MKFQPLFLPIPSRLPTFCAFSQGECCCPTSTVFWAWAHFLVGRFDSWPLRAKQALSVELGAPSWQPPDLSWHSVPFLPLFLLRPDFFLLVCLALHWQCWAYRPGEGLLMLVARRLQLPPAAASAPAFQPVGLVSSSLSFSLSSFSSGVVPLSPFQWPHLQGQLVCQKAHPHSSWSRPHPRTRRTPGVYPRGISPPRS